MMENKNVIQFSESNKYVNDVAKSGHKTEKTLSISEILRGKKTVAIGGHVKPDGDCVGSCVGLYLYIKKNFPWIEVDIYMEEIPSVYHFLTGLDEIKNQVFDTAKSYDIFISLDCADKERLGFALPLFRNGKMTLCIDHHVSNIGYGDMNIVVHDASSSSELVYNLLDDDGIDVEIANALFLGIVHDTGVFRFNTSPRTLEVAAALLRKGVKNEEIIEKTYYERTYLQTKIIGKALSECELILDDRCLFFVLTGKEMKEHNVITSDLDGIVGQLWLTKDIEVSIFIYELEEGNFKVSLRSSDKVDVSQIAKKFGGGGHKKAAGFQMTESSEVILSKICEEIKKFL
jgi:phosphoesterase RecJ-like protein